MLDSFLRKLLGNYTFSKMHVLEFLPKQINMNKLDPF